MTHNETTVIQIKRKRIDHRTEYGGDDGALDIPQPHEQYRARNLHNSTGETAVTDAAPLSV